MTPRLPSLDAKEVARALERAGFVFQRQKGSHATYRHPETKRTTVVPMHSGDIKRALLRLIIEQTGMTEEEFRSLL
ncbi:type II toxin-antitoxin system HicA family toxin [Methylocystis sp. Sn-Cys]|uniref:type II toxin-antitoxin system HicA family toxin n=1 Tax=Methylocystis sp. Sn-Cys TaxID=1701263 RepID=UPI001922E730|nr:type II toxin-antitoxin system HicA family toxin [Methylocystis sp. Sn-Cys]MBL1258557.1 type II toxin-antitoxin system HicA family toxin [Methylocystis sp. Sn-Cys]